MKNGWWYVQGGKIKLFLQWSGNRMKPAGGKVTNGNGRFSDSMALQIMKSAGGTYRMAASISATMDWHKTKPAGGKITGGMVDFKLYRNGTKTKAGWWYVAGGLVDF